MPENKNWISELVKQTMSNEQFKLVGRGACAICKGTRMLCGKPTCPLLMRAYSLMHVAPLINRLNIDGASPPSIFVGRYGYPKVQVGPLVPPIHGDTALYDLPEVWFGRSMEEIVGFRSSLVRGELELHVTKFDEEKIMDKFRNVAFAATSTNVELQCEHPPRSVLSLNDESPPFGPSARLQQLHVANVRWEPNVEKVYYDTDLKAVNAVKNLYLNQVPVTKIQRVFSIGAFGLQQNRRLVPTRWSITAVDDITSKMLTKNIKTYPLINEYLLFESKYLDNIFEVLVIPDAWSYEMLEKWRPGSMWNPETTSFMNGDREPYDGRTTYASNVGGAYYAAKLAVCERLNQMRRQAAVLVLREIGPGYIMPLGVWQVRENVRNATQNSPQHYNTLNAALQRICSKISVTPKQLREKSSILHSILTQHKLTEYWQENTRF